MNSVQGIIPSLSHDSLSHLLGVLSAHWRLGGFVFIGLWTLDFLYTLMKIFRL